MGFRLAMSQETNYLGDLKQLGGLYSCIDFVD